MINGKILRGPRRQPQKLRFQMNKALKNNRKLFMIMLLLLFPAIANAHYPWQVKIGGNYSYLKDPSYSEPGKNLLYGIGRDWRLYRWINLRTELLISRSTTALRNKSVQPSHWSGCFPYLSTEENAISYFDIDLHMRWLEIPFLFTVQKLVQKKLIIGMEIGYSLKFPIKDDSKSTFLRRINPEDLTEEARKSFRYNYRFTKDSENYSYAGNSCCSTFGLFLIYSRFQLAVRYQYATIDWVESIVLGDMPLHTINCSMGCRF